MTPALSNTRSDAVQPWWERDYLRRRGSALWKAGLNTDEIVRRLSAEHGRHIPEHVVANELARMRDEGRL